MEQQTLQLVSRLAAVIPPMTDDEYAVLEDIVLWRGTVIDGLHRLRACLKLGLEPRFTELPGNAGPLRCALGKNLARRHMNETARAAVAHAFSAAARPGRPAGSGENSANLQGFLTRKQAARACGVSERSVATVARVLAPDSGAAPGLRRAVRAGRIRASDAAKVTGEPAEVQNAALKMVAAGRVGTMSRAVSLVKEQAADREYGEPTGSSPGTLAVPSCTLHVSGLADLGALLGDSVSADVIVSEIANVELTHPRTRASSTEIPWRCSREIVKGGRRERDIRHEGSGLFDKGDCPEIGPIPQYGPQVSEHPGGDFAQAPEAASLQAGPLCGLH